MKAVIKDGSQQFLVKEGQRILIERTELEPKSTYSFEVLSIIKDDGETVVGNPLVDGATVEAEVMEQRKMKKLIHYVYRKRKGSAKKKGHRQQKTMVQISKIAL